MANTIMSAKNSFLEGLIMDFAPDNTQATCMTSALNATLLTFNGNEMSLLNDMGNARVETAYLPEGYVPVGSCEFGDIVYIVSYNPLTNKSLIGCFPSPERNISSEEMHLTSQNLSANDFLDIKNYLPTGKLITTSTKKVLIESKNLNPGDKYIIYTNNLKDSLTLQENKNCLSDWGKKIDPKYIKLHVVSIEDSGKIVYLDDTKWYGDYYIHDGTVNVTLGKTDLDLYRNLVSSEWSIFNTKVPGKLAILAELEIPETFSCSYSLEQTNDANYKRFKLTLKPYSDSKIQPTRICIEKASFGGSIPNKFYINQETEHTAINLDITGYVFDYEEEVPLKDDNDNFIEIIIPHNNGKPIKDDIILNLEIVPAMPFGKIDSLKVPISINFSKIGTGDVEISAWKYYNTNNTSILTYGINAYPENNWKVDNIIIQFFDNLGMVAEYLLNDRESYSGVFTEYIGLNGKVSNPRISRINSITNSIIYHKGVPIDKIIDGNIDNYTTENNTEITDTYVGLKYLNNAGNLYSGLLYAAKIITTYKHELPTEGDSIKRKINYRWYWTNQMFNEYYHSIKDFDNLNFELILNGEAVFETTNDYIWKQKELNNLDKEFNSGQNFKTNSANVQYIGYSRENNINMYINAGLLNDYNCFRLILEKIGTDVKTLEEKTDISTIDLELYLGESRINYNISENLYEFSVKEETISNPNYLSLNNSVNKNEEKEDIAYEFSEYIENAESLIDNIPTDKFNIYFNERLGASKDSDTGYIKHSTKLDKCYYISESNNSTIKLSMLALLFNKAYTLSNVSTIEVPVYTPIIDNKDDLLNLGIQFYGTDTISLAFKNAVVLSHAKDLFSGTYLTSSNGIFPEANYDDINYQFEGSNRLIDTTSNTDFINTIWGNISPSVSLFFPVYFGGYGKGDNRTKGYNAIAGTTSGYIPANNWKWWSGDTDKNRSELTNRSFDINGNTISGVDSNNSISFLGVKYKNGMTILNSAFEDGSNGSQLNLSALAPTEADKNSWLYRNFAYQLFLLLTNTYHKNKKIQNEPVNIKNYVRNGNYEIDLVKLIIIKLSCQDGDIYREDRNILLLDVNFKQYRELVIDNLFKDSGLNEDKKETFLKLINKKNVLLRLLSFANEHLLTIKVKSQPMSFFNTDVEAYIKRFGKFIPTTDLAINNFYVYQNEELKLYSSGPLSFKKDDITKTLQYIFEATNLEGVPERVDIIYTKEEAAYNSYIEYIVNYMISNRHIVKQCENLLDALIKRNEYIDNMYKTFPDSINGYSKLQFIQDLNNSDKNNLLNILEMNGLFVIDTSQQPVLLFINYGNIIEDTDLAPYKYSGKESLNTTLEFETHNFFNIFDYQNEFVTKSTLQLGNTFGVKDGGNDRSSAYTGFARDIMLDTNYRVV